MTFLIAWSVFGVSSALAIFYSIYGLDKKISALNYFILYFVGIIGGLPLFIITVPAVSIVLVSKLIKEIKNAE